MALGSDTAKKNITQHRPAGLPEKNYNTALAAGWMSELLCYNHFFVRESFRIKFGLEPDALMATTLYSVVAITIAMVMDCTVLTMPR